MLKQPEGPDLSFNIGPCLLHVKHSDRLMV